MPRYIIQWVFTVVLTVSILAGDLRLRHAHASHAHPEPENTARCGVFFTL